MRITTSQRGSALLISLVILTVITLGAVVAMQRTTLQTRMVGNMQHQQKVFNAAYSDLSALLNELRTSPNLTRVLDDAITAYHLDNNATIDPFIADYGLDKPDSPDNVEAVENRLRSFEPPSEGSSTALKDIEGSSGATLVPYYFTSTATVEDSAGSVSSTQQVGMYYLAPAQNQ